MNLELVICALSIGCTSISLVPATTMDLMTKAAMSRPSWGSDSRSIMAHLATVKKDSDQKQGQNLHVLRLKNKWNNNQRQTSKNLLSRLLKQPQKR